MDFLSPDFFSALGAIIVVNLVLSGDNAIVIALAARNLQPQLRNRAVLWGTVGAVAGRSLLTVVVVWLLKVPALMFVGGLMLVWIAYKLIIDNDGGGEDIEAASGFWEAMQTIVAADALMSLDNVLAVAGAANGHFGLVVLGLVISIPIVVFGSQLFLRFLERYPVIVYFGAGVLAWTAVKMMSGEPLLHDYLAVHPAAVWSAYLAVVGGVVGGGFYINHGKLRERVMQHVVDLASPGGPAAPAAGVRPARVLVPVDGSASALQGIRHVLGRAVSGQPLDVHLVNVRTPFSQYLSRFLGPRDRMAYHRYAGERALKAARRLLEQAGVRYLAHIELGPRAETIDRLARHLQVDEIVMGTARKNSLTRLLEDSVTASLLQLTRVPVQVVPGGALPLLERAALLLASAAMLAVLLGVLD